MSNKKKDLSKLPIYQMVIDPDDETSGVKMVSLLSKPAIEVKGHYFAPQDFDIVTPPCHQTWDGSDNCQCIIIDGEWTTGDNPCEFCLANKEAWDGLDLRYKGMYSKQNFSAITEQKLIIGPVLIPDIDIYRRDPKTKAEYMVRFSAEVITQIAEKFNKGNNNRSINIDHTDRKAPAFVRENWLVTNSIYDKSKNYGYDLPVGTWVWLVKIEDEDFWQKEVKELGKYSFSIEGLLGEKLLKFELIKGINDLDFLEELSIEQLLDIAYYKLKSLED
jgi:hypothetical protein